MARRETALKWAAKTDPEALAYLLRPERSKKQSAPQQKNSSSNENIIELAAWSIEVEKNKNLPKKRPWKMTSEELAEVFGTLQFWHMTEDQYFSVLNPVDQAVYEFAEQERYKEIKNAYWRGSFIPASVLSECIEQIKEDRRIAGKIVFVKYTDGLCENIRIARRHCRSLRALS
jgi:hypothetical protein